MFTSRVHSLILCLLALNLSSLSLAAVPTYGKPEILARANGPDYFNLPPMSFLNDTTAFINNQGDVAFKLMAVEGQNTQGLWMKKSSESAGKIVYLAPESEVMTDPTMDNHGRVIFSVFDEGFSDGIFVYDSATDKTVNVFTPKGTDLIAFSYLQLLDNGDIFFRATHDTDDRSLYLLNGELQELTIEGEDTLGFKASYLFGPVMNSQGEIATKIRLGNKKDWSNTFPDQIIVTDKSGNTRVVAEDQKGHPASPYVGFDNSVSIADNGLIAFVATNADKKKVLVIDDHGQQTIVATEGQDNVSEVEMFAPQVNSQGLVVFRAKDAKGKRAIFIADRDELRRVIGEDDEIPTDMGLGRIISDPNYPAFGGNVRMNDHGDIVFYALIISAVGDHDWGSAVYKLSPLY